jgi:tRNA threonylcarbamoyladenosine biosynthesis protein TsaB
MTDKFMPNVAPDSGVGQALAIETSGRVGSVSIGADEFPTQTIVFTADQRHAVELLPAIKELCQAQRWAPTDLSHVFVSGGPGSFTGLRIGVTVARTIAFATGARVVRVPTLDVIAQNASDARNPPPHIGVLLDAKRNRVFGAAYRLTPSGYTPTSEPREITVSDLIDLLPKPAGLIGEGILYAMSPDAVKNPLTKDVTILPTELFRAKAETVYHLGRRAATQGRFDNPRSLTPIYVRRPEAEEVFDRRSKES